MKLIRTTSPPPPDTPRLKPRRAVWKIHLIIWLIAMTVMLVLVLGVLVHLEGTLRQLLQELSS